MRVIKTKVLLIQGTIPQYRVDIFNNLAEKVDLTVIYSYGDLPENIKFKVEYIPFWKIRYKVHKKNIYSFAKKFDVVICMFDFSYIYSRFLYLLPHKYKLIYWGIGVSAGYNIRYDSDKQSFFSSIKGALKNADALVFYSSYPKEKYTAMGIKPEKMFVANNTVKVLPIEEREKDIILFVGSLYKQKKIFELLENYQRSYKKDEEIPQLVIIGDGGEQDAVCQWIKERGLADKIKLTGAIYDEKSLSEYFSRALVCISPDQAGLSVLKSMGYGVPFVTHKDAITGGEIFNIQNGVNGLLINSFDEIEEIISNLNNNKDFFIEMGEKAKEYYYAERTVDKMINGFVDAIEYVETKH